MCEKPVPVFDDPPDDSPIQMPLAEPRNGAGFKEIHEVDKTTAPPGGEEK